jgi:hypothetical protein
LMMAVCCSCVLGYHTSSPEPFMSCVYIKLICTYKEWSDRKQLHVISVHVMLGSKWMAFGS